MQKNSVYKYVRVYIHNYIYIYFLYVYYWGVYLQNGSLWGGEFSAKIFLKHWYLQCFPAMKALKPLF